MVAGLFNEKVGMMEKPLFVMPMLPENETICEVLSEDWPLTPCTTIATMNKLKKMG
jgi:hypothetical protein